MNSRKKIGICWILIICLLWGSSFFQVEAEEPLDLYSTAAVLMDGDSGRILYEKNGNAALAMASTTKIMTCILVLEEGELEDEVRVSEYAASMPKVKLFMKPGEQYLVKDLLYSLMLESHNDTAVALAEYMGKKREGLYADSGKENIGTREDSVKAVSVFAGRMNEKAKEIGCKNTFFLTPNGLDAVQTDTLKNGKIIQREHHTTAKDLALIMAYCIGKSPKKDQFLEITGTKNYSFFANGRSFFCSNHNLLLEMLPGAISGKTGFTNKAGYCYVGALRSEGRTFVVALLGCGWPNNKHYKWSDSKKMLRYGWEHFFPKSFFDEEILFDEKDIEPIRVENGRSRPFGQTMFVRPVLIGRQMEKKTVLLKDDEKIFVRSREKKSVQAPVKKGTVVGRIDYLVGNEIYRTETMVIPKDVEKITFLWCLLELLGDYFSIYA